MTRNKISRADEHIMKEYFLEIKEKCEKRQIRAYHIGVKQAENAAKEYLKNINHL